MTSDKVVVYMHVSGGAQEGLYIPYGEFKIYDAFPHEHLSHNYSSQLATFPHQTYILSKN